MFSMKALALSSALALVAAVLATPVAAQPTYYDGPITVNYYEPPADIQQARNACFRAEREARDIPGNTQQYVAWFEANRGTPAQLDWTAAHTACARANMQSGGMWNWDALVLARTEVHYG